ncbi:MAG: ribosome silencing factor [Thermoanaerobaculia bacterium]
MKSQPATAPDVEARCREVVAAAEERKAYDLRVLQLGEVTSLTDYFLICSGTSGRQVKAIADAIEQTMKGEGVRPLQIEGYKNARWVLMDYGDFVVHIFDQETRLFYRLERLWADAPDVTSDFAK